MISYEPRFEPMVTDKSSGVCLQGPNPSIRGVGAPMDGLSALPWTARWCQGTLPCVSEYPPLKSERLPASETKTKIFPSSETQGKSCHVCGTSGSSWDGTQRLTQCVTQDC